MSGYGIDLVDTFFGSMVGTTGRLLKFFLLCWSAAFLAILCLSLRLGSSGWRWDTEVWQGWYFFPILWAVSLVYACFAHWWFGIPFVVYLLGYFLQVVWNDGSSRRGSIWLFILQSWHTFLICAFVMARSGEGFWAGVGAHPLIITLVLITVGLAWRSYRPEPEYKYMVTAPDEQSPIQP